MNRALPPRENGDRPAAPNSGPCLVPLVVACLPCQQSSRCDAARGAWSDRRGPAPQALPHGPRGRRRRGVVPQRHREQLRLKLQEQRRSGRAAHEAHRLPLPRGSSPAAIEVTPSVGPPAVTAIPVSPRLISSPARRMGGCSPRVKTGSAVTRGQCRPLTRIDRFVDAESHSHLQCRPPDVPVLGV